jgi:citrate lyase beta subunit
MDELNPFSYEKPSKLDVWKVVNEQIARNRQARINWTRVFGMSLSKYVARCKAEGLSALQTLDKAITENAGLSDEARKRLKIGICARFGEINSEMAEYIKVKYGK